MFWDNGDQHGAREAHPGLRAGDHHPADPEPSHRLTRLRPSNGREIYSGGSENDKSSNGQKFDRYFVKFFKSSKLKDNFRSNFCPDPF